jgi:hypothetical protein
MAVTLTAAVNMVYGENGKNRNNCRTGTQIGQVILGQTVVPALNYSILVTFYRPKRPKSLVAVCRYPPGIGIMGVGASKIYKLGANFSL